MSETKTLKYFKHTLNSSFISMRPWYCFWMPLQMKSYKKLKEKVGPDMDREVGMIEQGKMFGRGRIGVATKDGLGDRDIEGEFAGHEIIGDYSQMKKIYPQIMKENPDAREYYTVYLTDPDEVPMEENKTWILFR